MKRLLIRLAAALLLVVLCVWRFIFGKGYTRIIDNPAAESGGRKYDPPAAAEIVVDGGKGIEIFARERDKMEVKGPFHTVEARIMDRGMKVLSTVRKDFTLAGRPMYILSVAGLAGGAGSFVREFAGADSPPPETSPPSAGPAAEDGLPSL